MEALAVSMFDDGPDMSHVQALFESEAEAKAALDTLDLPANIEHFITQLDDVDWVSKTQAGLPPVTAGRFFLYGSHDADKIPSTAMHPIWVDAGMAFGTGHHGTTKGCLIAFDTLLGKGLTFERVLDLGCGTGVLAIAAAKALGQTVWATDIDPDAIVVTTANAKANHCSADIDAFVADGLESPRLNGVQFDLIFANILAGPLIGLSEAIVRALSPGAHLILSGILDEQADWVADAFSSAGVAIMARHSEAGWTTLSAQAL